MSVTNIATTSNNPTGTGQTTVYAPSQIIPNSATQTSSAITPPTSTNATIIPASSLGSSPNLNLPSATQSSGVLPAASNIGTAASLAATQSNLQSTTDTNEQNAQNNYNGIQSNTEGLINEYLGEGQDELNQETSAGVPQLQQTSNKLTAQYNAQNAVYSAQYSTIMGGPGTLQEKEAQVQDLQQQNGLNLASIAAQQTIAQSDYTTALGVIQNNIQIKYAPLQDAITYQQNLLNNAQGILTAQQTNQFQANLQVQQQQYTQSTYYSNLNATTGIDMIKSAAANGADQATLQAMTSAVTNGGSIADIASAAGNYLSSGNYSMQYNPASGQMEPLNSNTGLFAGGTSGTGSVINTSDASSVNTVTDPSGVTMNFNASGYNTADPNYALKMQETIGNITSQVGTITDATSAQAAITKLAPQSNLTGADVIQAAQSAGIPATTFLAQLINESGCGTSHVAAQNNNYGGIVWANQTGATQGTPRPTSEGGYYAKFPTPEAGLQAQAELDKKSIAQPTATTTGQTATTQYSLTNYSALKNSLPSNLQPAFGYMTQTGDAYIDISKVTDLPGAPSGTAATKIEQFAAQHGITVLTGDQAAAMQDADTALTQINNLQNAWNAVAPTTGLNPLTSVSNAFDSTVHNTQGNLITKYLSMDTSGLDILNSITGSKRLSTFSATVAASALPQLQGLLPGDSLESGNQKLDDLRKEISASITPIIATSKGAPLSGEVNAAQTTAQPTQMSYNGVSYTLGADNLYHPI